MKELVIIQSELKAPKGHINKYGNYNYRSAEDILEAVKPLLKENDCTLTISDEIILIGDRYYIKATATLTNKDGANVVVSAYAREEETKKGMDASQITSSTSSYARKYALNGLFCIDDTKDADVTNTHAASTPPKQPTKTQSSNLIKQIKTAGDMASLMQIWEDNPTTHTDFEFKQAMTKRKNELQNE